MARPPRARRRLRPIDRERFEIRRVDAERRVYVFVTSDRKYVDACIIADTAISRWGGDYVVLDGHEGCRVLYDSRLFRTPEIIRRR